MKQIITLLVLAIALIAFSSNTLKVLKPFPPKANSGAPGEQTCIICHTGTDLNGGPGNIKISYNGTRNTYKAGKVYTFTVTVTDTSEIHYAFETTALDASNNPAGVPKLIDTTVTLIQTDRRTGRQYVTDYDATPLNTWTFKWQAPATDVGDVSFYLDGVAANGDLKDKGDHVYTSTPFVLKYKASTKEEDLESSLNVNVFPNPVQTTAFINYDLGQDGDVTLAILDNHGKLIRTLFHGYADAGTHSLSMDRSGLAAGIYFIRMETQAGNMTSKMLVQ